MNHDGKVAIVTGAASGIGRGIAERLAEDGASVLIADIDESSAIQVANALGERAAPFACNVTETTNRRTPNPKPAPSVLARRLRGVGG